MNCRALFQAISQLRIATTLLSGWPRNRGSIPGRRKRQKSSCILHRVQTGFRIHPTSYTKDTGATSPGVKRSWSLKLTTHFNLLPRLRMLEAILALQPSQLSTGTTSPCLFPSISWNMIGGTEENHDTSQDSRYPGRYLNRTPPPRIQVRNIAGSLVNSKSIRLVATIRLIVCSKYLCGYVTPRARNHTEIRSCVFKKIFGIMILVPTVSWISNVVIF
jgi:hypothetical protein